VPAGESIGLGVGTKVAAAVVGLLMAGGAAGFVLGVGPFAASGTAPISQVPAGADTVFYVDGDIRDDPATKALVNESLSARSDSEYYTGPESYEELRNQTNANTSLDPSKVEEVVSFGKYPPEDADPDRPAYWAVVMHADWSTEAVAAELKNKSTDRTWTEGSYNGHTVFKSDPDSAYRDPSWFGVLDDGEFVMGRPAAVKDAIDVAEGDQEPVGGEIRSEYDSLRDDALIAYVFDVPRERIPNQTVEAASEDAPVDYSVFTTVEMVSGTYYTTSDTIGVKVHMTAANTDGAKDVSDVTRGGVSFASGTVSNETLKDGLRDVKVTREKATVTVSYENSVSRVKQFLQALEQLGY
jgi:hypothetical protein